ncbi:hypothetical protein GW17_00053718 [Ensete ventricosum]|nr:hypothetical protein GW17_00053718 [Ensete ventricosum]
MVPTLTDYTNLKKLKIKGFLEKQSVIILIDAGSIQNFMSTRQLKEQLSANLDQLAVVRLAMKEAKKAWEEEQSYMAEQERRVMASYKEFDGFHCSLKHASQVAYKFGSLLTIVLLPLQLCLPPPKAPFEKVKRRTQDHNIMEARVLRHANTPAKVEAGFTSTVQERNSLGEE